MGKEKQIYEDPKVLNVATKLAEACLKNEDMLYLLLFSIIVKHNNLSGRLTNLKVNVIRDLCGCSKKQACRILELAKKDKFFFDYDQENDVLTARNIKKPYTKKFNHPIHGEIWRIDVIQFTRYNEDKKIRFTFRYLRKEIKKLLLVRGIKLCENNYKYHFHEQNSSMHVAMKYKCGIHGTNLLFPSHKQMCKIIGATNEKYVYRLLRELMGEGRLEKVERCQLLYIGNYRIDGFEEVERRCKCIHTKVVDKRTGSVYAASPNVYRTTGRGYGGARNIILNHEGRMTIYYKKAEVQSMNAENKLPEWYGTYCNH